MSFVYQQLTAIKCLQHSIHNSFSEKKHKFTKTN